MPQPIKMNRPAFRLPALSLPVPSSARRRLRPFAAGLLGFALLYPAGVYAQAAPSQPTPSPAPQQKTTAAPGTIAVSPGAAAALAPGAGPSYDNRFEVYGGLSFMNGQAGQNLNKRYNMGGGEAMGTYWLTRKLGVAADYRIEAGTTPVVSPFYNRVLVVQQIFAGGVQYRGPKNRYAAVDFHALAGGSDGIFDSAIKNYPGGSPVSSCPANQQPGQQGNVGLYCNHIAPWGAAGGSIDFNQGAKLAVRLSPDMIFEHYGTETREFFSISLGVMYRYGKK
jgi:hypothetical protein